MELFLSGFHEFMFFVCTFPDLEEIVSFFESRLSIPANLVRVLRIFDGLG